MRPKAAILCPESFVLGPVSLVYLLHGRGLDARNDSRVSALLSTDYCLLTPTYYLPASGDMVNIFRAM